MSKERQLTIHLGILWDKESNPHCPACETPLGAYAAYGNSYAFKCVKCNRLVEIWGDGAEPKTITIDEARAGLAAKLKRK